MSEETIQQDAEIRGTISAIVAAVQDAHCPIGNTPSSVCQPENAYVSCADIALEDFVITERDAAEMQRLMDNKLCRPRMSISDDHIIIE